MANQFHFITLDYSDALISLALVGATALAGYLNRLAIEKDLLIGSFRVFIQLIAVGWLLDWIFKIDSPGPVLLMLLAMTAIASYNAVKRVGEKMRKAPLIAAAGIIVGASTAGLVTLHLVIKIEPWFNPQYTITISGMIINAAMNSIAIGMATFNGNLAARHGEVEAALSLGAGARDAARPLETDAVRKALIPTINAMMTAGIVQLPGMMTGQIIAGAPPRAAVIYQIVVFYMISAASALAALTAVRLYARSYFNGAHQLCRMPD